MPFEAAELSIDYAINYTTDPCYQLDSGIAKIGGKIRGREKDSY